VLKVLEEADIPIDMVAGTSLGALVGGLYAANPNACCLMEQVEAYLHSFRARHTYLGFIHKIEDNAGGARPLFADMANLLRKGYFWSRTATKAAFVTDREYRRFIYPLLPDYRIENLKLPFCCIATDIMSGSRIVYRRGSIRHAVSASCALPGIFPPVADGGRLLVDGGWVERVPVIAAREMGADLVIAVDVSATLPDFPGGSGVDIIMRANAVTRVHLNDMQIERADVILHPSVGNRHWADFSRPAEMYEKGEEAARAMLPAIQAAIAARG
jgi:NTE family protein